MPYHCVVVPLVDSYLQTYEAATKLVHHQPLLIRGKTAGCHCDLACFPSPKTNTSFDVALGLLKCIFDAEYHPGGKLFTEFLTRHCIDIPQDDLDKANALSSLIRSWPSRRETSNMAVTEYGGSAWDETPPNEVLKRTLIRRQFDVGTDRPDSVVLDPGNGMGGITFMQQMMSNHVVAIGVERELSLSQACQSLHAHLLVNSWDGRVATRHMDLKQFIGDGGMKHITNVSAFDGHPDDVSSLQPAHIDFIAAYMSTASVLEFTTSKVISRKYMDLYEGRNENIRKFRHQFFPVKMASKFKNNTVQAVMWIRRKQFRLTTHVYFETDYDKQTISERMITAAKGPQKRRADSCFNTPNFVSPEGTKLSAHRKKIQIADASPTSVPAVVSIGIQSAETLTGLRWAPGDEMTVDGLAYKNNPACVAFVNEREFCWYLVGMYYNDTKDNPPLCVVKCCHIVNGEKFEDKDLMQLWAVQFKYVSHLSGGVSEGRAGAFNRDARLFESKIFNCLHVLFSGNTSGTHTRRQSVRVAARNSREEDEETDAVKRLEQEFQDVDANEGVSKRPLRRLEKEFQDVDANEGLSKERILLNRSETTLEVNKKKLLELTRQAQFTNTTVRQRN